MPVRTTTIARLFISMISTLSLLTVCRRVVWRCCRLGADVSTYARPVPAIRTNQDTAAPHRQVAWTDRRRVSNRRRSAPPQSSRASRRRGRMPTRRSRIDLSRSCSRLQRLQHRTTLRPTGGAGAVARADSPGPDHGPTGESPTPSPSPEPPSGSPPIPGATRRAATRVRALVSHVEWRWRAARCSCPRRRGVAWSALSEASWLSID